MLLSGAEFNKQYHGTGFYKFLYNNLKIYNTTYNIELNVDVIPFNPTDNFTKGMCFYEKTKYPEYSSKYGNMIAIIEIPDDSIIYIKNNEFKADRFIITKIIDISDMPYDFLLNMLKCDGLGIKYVKNKTNLICEIAVGQNGHALEYITNKTDKVPNP